MKDLSVESLIEAFERAGVAFRECGYVVESADVAMQQFAEARRRFFERAGVRAPRIRIYRRHHRRRQRAQLKSL